MAKAIAVSRAQFEEFILERGFRKIEVEGTLELVYAKIVMAVSGRKFSLRVYSSINPTGESRRVGADAIRVVPFWKNSKDEIMKVGSDRRVHRVEGWRENLAERLEHWPEQLGPDCNLCGLPTVLRKPKRKDRWSPFFGCCTYPLCKGTGTTDTCGTDKEGSI